jgi:hypothetical protein
VQFEKFEQFEIKIKQQFKMRSTQKRFELGTTSFSRIKRC